MRDMTGFMRSINMRFTGLAANNEFPSLAYVASKFALHGMTKAAAVDAGMLAY